MGAILVVRGVKERPWSTWFTADQRFGHAWLLELSAARDAAFPTVAEMNAWLVHNWNAIIQPDDTAWVLGDFDMHGKDATLELVSRFVGTTVRRRVDRGCVWQADVPAAELPCLSPGSLRLCHLMTKPSSTRRVADVSPLRGFISRTGRMRK